MKSIKRTITLIIFFAVSMCSHSAFAALPTINNLSGDTLVYKEGDGPKIIDQGTAVKITDTDTTNWTSGYLWFYISSGYVSGEDYISIDTSGDIELSAGMTYLSLVTVSGIQIGDLGYSTFLGDTSSGLAIRFNINATPELISTLAGAITYENKNTIDPQDKLKQLTIQVYDPAESTVSVNARIIDSINDAPTFTVLSGPVDSTNEDTEVEITFDEIALRGNEADTDGTVTSFIVKSLISGSLKIGPDSGSATPFAASSNDTIDISNNAYWTPALNANGILDAFRIVAKDDGTPSPGEESIGPVITQVTVTAVNDTPTLDPIVYPAAIDEDAGEQTVNLSGIGAGPNESQGLTVTATSDNTGLIPDPTVTYTSPNATGSLAYTPVADQNGTAVITVRVTDDDTEGGAELFIEQDFTITVDAVDDIVDDAATTDEDTAATINVLVNDTFEGTPDVTAVESLISAANGTVVLNGDDTITYTPDADYNGSDSFDYTVTSGGVTETGTVTVTINAINDAIDDTATTDEDSPVIISVLANDTFIGTPKITAVETSISATNGTVVLNGDDTVTYTPDPDFNGTDSFDYTAAKGVITETATVTVTINAINDAIDDTATTDEDNPVIISVLANDTFEGIPDVTAVETSITAASGTVVLNGDDTITYTPDADFNGTDSFDYTVTSGTVTETATVTVTVNAVADIVDDTATTDEDNPVIISVLANDTFEGIPDVTAVETSITAASGTVVLNGDDTITYTPDADFNGTDSFDYTVTSGGLTETATVTVTVNAVADIVDDTDTTDEDTATIITVLANDTFEGTPDVTAVESVVSASNGTVVINGDDTVTYTPDADFNGSDSFDYTVTSGTVTETATVTVTVNAVSDIVDDTDTTDEDTATIITVLANDTFEGTPSVTAVETSTSAANGTVVINGDDTVTYTPDADFNGTDSFDYTVTSGTVTETATVTVTINPVNDPPNNTVLPALSGTPHVGRTLATTDGTWDDSTDLAPGTITYTYQWQRADDDADTNLVDIPGASTNNYTLTLADNGKFIRVKVTATDDGEGLPATASTDAFSSYAQIINAAPVITQGDAIPVTMDEDSTPTEFILILDATDSDTIDTLTWSISSAATNGPAAVSATPTGLSQVISYDPDWNYNGSDSFDVQVDDGLGGTDTITVNVTVNPRNDSPIATDILDETKDETDAVVTFTPISLDDYISDIETADQDMTWTYSGNSQLSVSIDADRIATVTAPANWNGSETITFQAEDTGDNGDAALTDSDDATFTINPINDAPTIDALPNFNINEDVGLTLTLSGIDEGGGYDEDVQVLTVTASSGDTAIAPDPSVTYTDGNDTASLNFTPVPDANGIVTISITVTDDDPSGVNNETVITFDIILNPVNDPPSFTKGSDQEVLENSGPTTVVNWATLISEGPVDEAGQALTFNVTNDNNALFSAQPSISASGTLTFTPETDQSGTATVTVELSDNGGTASGGVDTSDSQTFIITVRGRPVIYATPSAFTTSVPYGTNASNQIFTITNDNADKPNPLDLKYSISENSGGWITSVTPDSNTLAPGASNNVTIEYNTAGLNPGTYNASILITDVNGYDPDAWEVSVKITTNPIITVSATTNGSIDPAGPSVIVPYGTDQVFTITPDTANDYNVVLDVVVNGISVLVPKPISGPTTYTFPAVTSNGQTISATFDDHGTGTCIDLTPDDNQINYERSDNDYSTTLEFTSENSPPFVVTGSIDPVEDRDFFKIIVPSGGGILSAYTVGNLDTHGTLMDVNCDIIEEHDDINGTLNPNFKIVRNVNAGTYYLQVREGFETSTGTYTLHVELEADDHSDTCDDGATVLTCNADSVAGEINPGGDRDYFKLAITESKLITVYTQSSGQMDTYGVIYDDNCDEIAHNNDDGNDKDFRIEWQLPGPVGEETERTYYVGVRHLNATETGDYTLNLECAQAFSINSYANFGGTINPQGLVIVAGGSDESFEINANYGNTISDVLINGVSVNDMSSEAWFDGADFTYDTLNKDVDTSYTFQFNGIDQDWSIQAEFNVPPEQCVDIADYPLDARINAAAPNIMVLMDDSQSMDWEIMTLEGGSTGVSSGQMTIGNKAFHYLYNLEDRVNKTGQGSNVLLDDSDRMHWKSQWQGHNKIYYKSAVDYDPWPTKLDVDPNTPPSRPDEPDVIANMSDTYVIYGDTSAIVYLDNENTNNPSSPATFEILDGDFDTATDSTAYGDDDVYYWTPGTTNPDDYSVIWRATDHDAGEYEVFVRYVSNETRSDNVPYDVTYSDGLGGTDTATVYVNQSKNGGTWISLGTYNFDANAGSVSITLTAYDIADGTVSIDAVKFEPTDLPGFNIPIAHYYTCDGDENIIWLLDNQDIPYTDGVECTGDPWLVTIDQGAIRYFKFEDDDSDDEVDNGELTEYDEANVPASVVTDRTYEEERQNFANWFTYYRKRDLLTRAAVSAVVTTLKGVNVGFRSLEGSLTIPVQPVNVSGADETSYLLDGLYAYPLELLGAATSSSPVRRAFDEVGKYFDLTDGGDDGNIGPSPIATQEDGGGCQQNFVIIFSDAYYNGLSAGSMLLEDNSVGEYSGYAPYISGTTNTVADIAMNYYARDLAPEIEDEVPTNPFDSATHQHLVTYSVTFGVIGTLNPDDYDVAACEEQYKYDYDYEATGDVDDAGSPPCPPWPQINNDTKKIDDLWHAAVNGRGEFHSASDVNELIQAFKSVLENIEARIGSAASVSVNGDELYGVLGEDVRMYQSSYSTDGWTGDVKSYTLDVDTGEVITTSWIFSAADELEEKVRVNNEERIIATYDGSAGIPFDEDLLTETQKTQLLSGWEDTDATVAQMVDYLRGKDDNEVDNGGIFRNRVQVLGDIVHSSPQFDNDVLYTGGNDGLLHAFSAATGEELFAYIPNLVFDKLPNLALPNYSHLYYVDLTPISEAVRETDINGDTTTTNILVGGLGKGGRGYYALDITGINGPGVVNDESDLADRVIWEFPKADTAQEHIDDMGYSYSKPAIVETYDTTNAPTVVIFGNGYNSINSHAVLFIMDPLTGEVLKKIDTGVVVASGSQCNGLGTPIATDVNLDRKVDYVYAGDLYGNMWKFDLTSSSMADWGVAFGTDNSVGDGISYDATDVTPDDPEALFQAKGPLAFPQPITTKPDVLAHCESHGYIVVFGTGKYLGESDYLNSDTQSIYGVWDYGDDEDNSEYLGTFQRSSSQRLSNMSEDVTLLHQVWLSGDFVSETGRELRILTDYDISWQTVTDDDGEEYLDNPGQPLDDLPECTNNLDDDGDGLIDEADTDECPPAHAGWYVDVPAGERIANDIFIRQGKAVLLGFQPEQTPCGTGGTTTVMELDACGGGRLDEPQLDINEDKVIDVNDLVDIGGGEFVPPTGIVYEGRLMPPAILRKAEEEIKYFSTNVGSIITLTERAVTLGLTYWRELE